jgi:hypothetical protein
MDLDNPGAVSTGEEEAERKLNTQDQDIPQMAPEWLTLMESGRLNFFFPRDDLGSRVSIVVAKAPVSFWVVTFGYYTVITTKNTLFFSQDPITSTATSSQATRFASHGDNSPNP